MANFFYWIFKITSAHKLLSAGILLVVMALSVASILRLNLEEDIVAIMPKDANVEKVSEVFKGFSMNKRIVVHVYSSHEGLQDSLISTSQTLADSLEARVGKFIGEIKQQIPDSQIQILYNYYLSNLPFYLKDQDYRKIEERITNEGIDLSVKQLYKSLMSPMGVVTKTMRVKDPFGLAGFPLDRTKQLQLDDNFSLYKNHILTKDKRHLVFFIELENSPNETAQNGALIAALDELSTGLNNKNNTIQIEYFGAAAVAVANANRIKDDIYLTVTLALIGLFLFISLFYRKASTFFIVVTPGVFGGLVSVGILGLVKDQVSVISLAVGSVLLGITIDYALHFFTHAKKEKNLAQLFKDLTVPMLLSSTTTACAFFSLLFIRSTALQDLGLFAGCSVISAALYTLIVLPHFISGKKEKENTDPNWVERLVGVLAEYPLYKKKWALIAVLALSILSFFTWNNVSFESNMLGLNYMPKNLAAYEKNINEISNYSANNIYLASTGKDIWQALAANESLEEKLEKLVEDSAIYNYVTLNTVVPTLSVQKDRLQKWQTFWQKHGKERVVQTANEKATAIGFNSNTFKDFEATLQTKYERIETSDLENLMSVIGEDLVIYNEDGSVSVLSIVKLSAQQKPPVLDQLAVLPHTLILDRGYLTGKLVTLLKEDFNKLVNISLLVVFVIILIGYGRIELAIIAFLPIVMSWLWVLGLMGLFGLEFNIVNIIVCTFIFGLGIDYSIFVMRGLTQEYKHGVDNLISFKKSIILSVVTTLLGIGVLAFAQHPALKSIALLAIIGIISVIIITFTVEHLLYKVFIGGRKHKGVVPFTLASLGITIFAFLYFLTGCVLLHIARVIFMIPFASQKFRKHIFHWLMMIFCGSLVHIMANFKKDFVDKNNADYSKPSVIIANHHSFIDILIMLAFSPKVVMVTNEWVYNSPFFGRSVQYADFILAAEGVEDQMEKIESLVAEGFSIIVFPEGTRTGTFELRRFHKGAFYLAEQLKLDIQPILLHGTSLVMPKGDDFYLKNNLSTIKFLPRIKHDDPKFGTGYKERTKKISKHFKSEYNKLREQTETPEFFREIIVKNFLFKGPILEWYVKIKFRLEEKYQQYHELIPRKAKVLDLGCGYGIMSYALAFGSPDRKVKGVDYDAEKINVAQECPAKPENISFEQGDVLKADFEDIDVFLLSDVLHYLTDQEQSILMKNMANHLSDEGMIMIRDGDSQKSDRHRGTMLTEFFSTNFGFNKTRNKLNYISADFMQNFATENNLQLQTIDITKRTSNTLFVLKRK